MVLAINTNKRYVPIGIWESLNPPPVVNIPDGMILFGSAKADHPTKVDVSGK